jgi:hypothetical protein
MSEKKNLPKIQELQLDPKEAFKYDQLKAITNEPPIQKFIKQHPFAKGVKYIPIDKIEFLLDRIFQQWRVEVKDYQQLFNSVTVSVRLHYLDPITGQWNYHDGVGAVGIQTDKGKAASDLTAVKQDAVMKALPAAKSYAIKDAAEHFGALFGRDLNRKDTMAFNRTRKVVTLKELREKFEEVEANIPSKRYAHIQRVIGMEEENHYAKALEELKTYENE